MFVGPAGWLRALQSKALRRLLTWWVIGFIVILTWFKGWPPLYSAQEEGVRETPLLDGLFRQGRGDGGRWYIPPSWGDDAAALAKLTSPAEAAQRALELCVRQKRFLAHSKIPMIIHQTWKTSRVETWPEADRLGAEAWLEMAVGEEPAREDRPPMAYIFWDDDAMNALVSAYEKELWEGFRGIPHGVEKADIFRVLLMKWFGGVYADVDAQPLQHPVSWVHASDLTDWQDENGETFTLHPATQHSYRAPAGAPAHPPSSAGEAATKGRTPYRDVLALADASDASVAAIVGIEADTPAGSDDAWRAGYDYNVQVTNWAMAMAPQHPVAARYARQVDAYIRANASRLERVDPLEFTGPPAFTRALKEFAEMEDRRFGWDSVSGLKDPVGGRGKVVAGDVLVLPITGFSPGRGKFNNMGSQPLDHPNARLSHIAQGSWRKTSLKVEAGKLCRTLFGLCKTWSKVP